MYDLSSSSFLKSSISQKEQFSNGAILKWSISQMEQFSNRTFLKWSNSQMEHFGVATLCHISRSQEQRNMACDVLASVTLKYKQINYLTNPQARLCSSSTAGLVSYGLGSSATARLVRSDTAIAYPGPLVRSSN